MRHPTRRFPVLPVALAALLLVGPLVGCGGDDATAPPTNHAPAAPANATAAGSPADGAADVALDAVLRWTCVDQDGDELTYDVHFGTGEDPPAAATGLTGTSYGPTLAAATTYRWRVVARDGADAATSSAVWSFTTLAAPAETVAPPSTPAGPAAATNAETPTYTTGGAVSSEGHDVEYRFDWGDGEVSAWSVSTSASHQWLAAGTYDVMAQARCAADTDVESAWSAALAVTVTAVVETVGAPDAPDGPAAGETGAVLVFTPGGAVSSEGHAVEYRLDFGDGTVTTWAASGPVAHSWAAAGSYDVIAQARCAVDTDVESAWSAALTVVVSDPAETVHWPATPTGPTNGNVDEPLEYSTSGGSSSEGHALEYRFDWNDGTMSDWGDGQAVTHAWSVSGTYAVRAQARCAEHTDATSPWSSSRSVLIGVPEVVTRPDTPSGTTPVEVDVAATYSTGGASSTYAHSVDYRFDWGDGTQSDWSGMTSAQHAWSVAGTYDVTAYARCRDDIAVESVASLPLTVTVEAPETVSTPDPPAGAAETEIQVSQQYDFSGAVSSWGHDVEYRADFGDGTVSSWFVGAWQAHTWTTPGTYDVIVQARCQDHPAVESAWSAATTVTVTEPAETVTPAVIWNPPAGGGVDDDIQIRGYGGASNLYHQLEGRFDWGDGSMSDWAPTVVGYYQATHAWSVPGTYELRVQVRCIEHPDAVADWSAPASLEIFDTETISAPGISPGADQNLDLGDYLNVMAYGAESNVGHSLEYQADWGDGTMSDWSLNSGIPRYWNAEGDFSVRMRARCRTHTDVVSDWSPTIVVHVVDIEDITAPTLGGPSTGNVGVEITYTAEGAVSSHGHDLEYQLYWSTYYGSLGTGLGWTTIDNLKHTFPNQGYYYLRVRARCIEHQIESSNSNRFDVYISP